MTPHLLNWKCINSTCSACGIEKKMMVSSCPILNNCHDNIPLLEWNYAPRQGLNKRGRPNTQLELSNVTLPVVEVIKKLIVSLAINRKHQAQYEWRDLMRKIDLTMSNPHTTRVICTDFGATLDLGASEKDNSSVNNHAVIAIFLVSHNWRQVIYKKEKEGGEKEDDATIVNDCDKWIFFGDT